MLTSINIATFPSRENELKVMLKSIENQFDIVRLYFNNISERPSFIPDWVDVYCGNKCNGDLTDNGKFFFVDEDEYYFTADDDIAYPPTYCKDMVEAIKRTGMIVTHHGRKLRHLNVSYYKGGHKMFMCLHANDQERIIDVAGTGVTAFDTRYFKPTDLWSDDYQKMSDIIFSLEAAKQNKKIKVLKHSKDYFRYLFPDENTTIHQQEFRNCHVQTKLANEIYLLNYGTPKDN